MMRALISVLSLSLLASSVASASEVMAESMMNATGQGLCERLGGHGTSVQEVGNALVRNGVIRKGPSGTKAEAWDKSLAKYGLRNGYPPKAQDIPMGSVLVIDGGSGCPGAKGGDSLLVKCGGDKVFNPKMGSEPLSRYLLDHPKCVKAVLAPKSGNKIIKSCGQLEKIGSQPGKASSVLRQALGAPESASINTAEDDFLRQNFRDIGGYRADLPAGGLYVLDRKLGCPAAEKGSEMFAIRCGPDQVHVGKSQLTLGEFERDYGGCVKAARFKPEWSQPIEGALGPRRPPATPATEEGVK